MPVSQEENSRMEKFKAFLNSLGFRYFFEPDFLFFDLDTNTCYYEILENSFDLNILFNELKKFPGIELVLRFSELTPEYGKMIKEAIQNDTINLSKLHIKSMSPFYEALSQFVLISDALITNTTITSIHYQSNVNSTSNNLGKKISSVLDKNLTIKEIKFTIPAVTFDYCTDSTEHAEKIKMNNSISHLRLR